MNLHRYKTNEIEEMIIKKYTDHGIRYASDMDIDRIADIFDSMIVFTKDETRVIYDEGFAMIRLNGFGREEVRRQNFFHELTHLILHAGNQHNVPPEFVALQESQSAHVQFYAAMPIYLFEEFRGIEQRSTYIKVLSEEFRLPIPFVTRRVEQIERRILQAKLDDEFQSDMNPVRIEYDYNPETRRVLSQLHKQLSRGVVTNG